MDNMEALYYASSGPDSDPTRRFASPGLLNVVAKGDAAEPLGRAQLAGWLLAGRKPMATYRLVIDGDELAGLFTCVEGRFELVVA